MKTLRIYVRLARFVTYVAWCRFTIGLRHRLGWVSDAYVLKTKKRVTGKVLRIMGVRVTQQGDAPPSGRPRLIVANHRTALDIGVLMSALGGSFLSRADLAGWPIAGRLAVYARTIFVERGNRSSGANAIRAIRRRLEVNGTVLVFPEGTTLAGDEVRTFKAGAFVALRKLEDVEVIPVGLAYPEGTEFTERSFVAHIRNICGRPRTKAVMCVGEPLRAEGDAREMAKRAQEAVQSLVYQARTLANTTRTPALPEAKAPAKAE